MSKKPIIGITCDCGFTGDYANPPATFFVQQKYVLPVLNYMDAVPLIVPNFPQMDLAGVVASIDGLIVSGSPANVASELYGLDPSVTPPAERDLDRDNTVIPLINKMIEAEKPLLAICRGIQELNVARGGTLQREIQHIDGNYEHYLKDKTLDFDDVYKVRQTINLTQGGILAGLNDGTLDPVVNSIHGQAIDRLADDLVVEATSPTDGIIEAVHIKDYPTFGLAVQWHPEHWESLETAFNRNIFTAFRDAVYT